MLLTARCRRTIVAFGFSLLIASSAIAETYLLSGDKRWVVIASREELSLAKMEALFYEGAKVFRSDNGWYAVVIGPTSASSVEEFSAGYSGYPLPDDIYLARGKNFVSLEWSAEESRDNSASNTSEPSGSGSGDYLLSGDDKWVVIASREDLSEAKALAGARKGSRIFRSDNGWYAVVIGPFPARTMDNFLSAYNGPDLPDDSYLARGKNFVSLEWSAGETRQDSASRTNEPSGSGSGNYSLSGDDKSVVIASREDLSEAKALAGEHKGSRIFKSDNGWYAVVIGPFPARTMDDFLNAYNGPSLPDDSYLARGKNFVSQEWPVQTSQDDGSVAEAEASDDVKMVQFLLAIADYDIDEIDGQLGAKTEDAIRQYQSDWELTETGEITPDLVSRLRGEHDATRSRWQKIEGQDCSMWNEDPQAREKASWSGGCIDGKASGKGILVWDYVAQGETRTSTADGEYRAGKLNGPGIYAWANGARYEGGWSDGDRHGHGMQTWADGDRYEGEWREDERHGRGVEVWNDGGRYEGEWSEGAFNGKGVRTWADGDRYDGEWSEGKKYGQGTYTWANGDRYEGEYTDNKENGQGVQIWANGHRYDGEWREGVRTGQGVYSWPNGDRYDGEWSEDKQHRQGTYTSADSNRYEGEWKEDKRHGQGVQIWANGNRYDGEWRDGKQDRQGTYTWANGDRYEGEWNDEKRTGRGFYTWPDGSTYEGDFEDGKISGHGVRTFVNGNRYKGEFSEDKFHGRGTFVWADGDRYEGEWRDDRAHGWGALYDDGELFRGDWWEGCLRVGNQTAAIGRSLASCGG